MQMHYPVGSRQYDENDSPQDVDDFIDFLCSINVDEYDKDESITTIKEPEIDKSSQSEISKLQWECTGLKPLLAYMVNDELPENDKLKKKIIMMSQQYVVRDNVL